MSAIRMSSGFGSSGQKRTPEKVVMEPSGIQPKNHAGYNEHNTHLLFSATTQGPPFPGISRDGPSCVVAGSAACRLGRDWPRLRGDSTPESNRDGAGAGGVETGPASSSRSQAGRTTEGSAVVLAVETKFFLSSAGQEQ